MTLRDSGDVILYMIGFGPGWSRERRRVGPGLSSHIKPLRTRGGGWETTVRQRHVGICLFGGFPHLTPPPFAPTYSLVWFARVRKKYPFLGSR